MLVLIYISCIIGVAGGLCSEFHYCTPQKHAQADELQSSSYLPYQQAEWVHLPDNKVHGANMGPIWVQQDPGGPHVGPMNFAIWANITKLAGETNWPSVTL